ncbi:acidic juvenile hormone-suppressible protein 1-like [Epargyreus clarus]|uniref:acidic juvenile hormone-suppressible protein 1-like n=1 Tax=Epargyreus clarus TaxID=520877 RepID=UPI003C2CFCCD
MMRVLLVALALVAVGAFAEPIKFVRHKITGDKEFLKKQTELLQLYHHIHEPVHDPELHSISVTWTFQNTRACHGVNETALNIYADLMKTGRILPRGVPFAVYQPQQQFEAVTLFNLLYSITEYDKLYKTVVYLRDRINEGLFVYVLGVVTLNHPLTQGIVLPPIYEVFPSFFHTGEVMTAAQRFSAHGPRMLENYPNTYLWEDNFVIKWNETTWPYYYKNFLISYFTNDYQLNTAYYNHHVSNPFWLSSTSGPLSKYRRGEYFWYLHKQIMTRYYMERLSNGLGEIPDLDYNTVEQGYTSGLLYHNGIPFPSRPNHFSVDQPMFVDYMNRIKDVESRIRAAIDLGYVLGTNGERIDIRNVDSFDLFGRLIEANVDSPNPQFYHDFIGLWKTVLGNSLVPSQRYINGHVPLVVPSVLENYQTALRDPAFYMIWKRVMKLFNMWSSYLPRYKHEDLAVPSVKIEKVEVDKLVTYFENVFVNVSNHVYTTSEQTNIKTGDVKVLVQQAVLNHKPFEIRMHVKSNVAKNVVVRYFLAPKYDGNGVEIPLHLNTHNFFQLDQFTYELPAGECVIKRQSNENIYMVDGWRTFTQVYQRALDAYNGKRDFVLDGSEFFIGYPRRLLLPKGRVGGMPFVLMAYIHEYVAPKDPYGTGLNPKNVFGLGTGSRRMTNYPLGFPLDRPLGQWQVDNLENMHIQDVNIFHKPIPEMKYPFQLLSSRA